MIKRSEGASEGLKSTLEEPAKIYARGGWTGGEKGVDLRFQRLQRLTEYLSVPKAERGMGGLRRDGSPASAARIVTRAIPLEATIGNILSWPA